MRILNNNSNQSVVENGTLVLTIQYGSNTKKYYTKENYLDNFKKKKVFLNQISEMI